MVVKSTLVVQSSSRVPFDNSNLLTADGCLPILLLKRYSAVHPAGDGSAHPPNR